jgi:AcrR family transcriptional regulator
MPSPRPRRRMGPDARREQLLQTAVRVAARGEAPTVSLAELTVEAGVSAGLLYHYFPTKEALLEAAIDRAAETLLVALEPSSAMHPLERALTLLHSYLRYVEAHPEPWLALTRSDCGARARADTAVEWMVLKALNVAQPGPGLTVAVRAWLGFLREGCAAWIEHPELHRRALSNALIDALLVAIQAVTWYDSSAKEALALLGAA